MKQGSRSKRTAKQIRLDTVAEVAEKDKMRARAKAKKLQGTKEQPYCCEDKYGDNLPQRFVQCFDCPKIQKST